MANIKDILRLLRKLKPDELKQLDSLKGYIDSEAMKTVKMLMQQRKLSISYVDLVSTAISDDAKCPLVKSDEEQFANELNDRINRKAKAKLRISLKGKGIITSLIGSEIVGFEFAKKAIALQLFSKEHFHILLLGDPGTGKTVLLHSAADLSPVSSFGLGSGTSGAGLAVTVQAKEVLKGLLPMADGGICSIDELNLMKEDSRASLYNAMEKGFVTYDKGGKHFKFDANISVLATANPKKDRFVGKTIKEMKAQIPFDDALLSRFHLVFFILRPDEEQFKAIAKNIVAKKKSKIVKKDAEFIQEYIKSAWEIEDVDIPKEVESKIVDFSASIKKKEKDLLVDVSPRFVVGLLRMIKASARADLRSRANRSDLKLVLDIVKSTLNI